MSSSPHTLGEVTAHLEHAVRTYVGFTWGTANQPCPDGRYLIDWHAKILYLDPGLTGDEVFAAVVAACVELDANTAYRDPARERRLAPHAVQAHTVAGRHSSIRHQRLPARTAATTARRRTLMTSDDPSLNLMTGQAHSARIYDYFLGGKTNYPPDRAAATAILQVLPDSRSVAREQRAFMHRSAAAVAEAGIGQFLDIGTGIPTEPNLHQIVQAVNPAARVVYVDNDPIVLVHADALMRSDPRGRTAYVQADATAPASILSEPLLTDVLDLDRPIGVSIIGLLHFLDDTQMSDLLSTMRAIMAPGSHLTINQATVDNDPRGSVRAAIDTYRAQGLDTYARTRAQVTALLTGLDILEPGVVSSADWRPTGKSAPMAGADQSQWAAVARTP